VQNKLTFLNNNRVYYYVIVAYIVLFVLFTWGYKHLGFYEEEAKNTLLKHSIGMVDDTSSNILAKIVQGNENLVRAHLLNEALRVKSEKDLRLMKTHDIKSIYVLYPVANHYFFLLDGDENDHAEVNEPFLPENSKAFQEVYRQQKKKVFVQKEIDDLSFTLIKPIIQKNKTVAFLVIDYNKKSDLYSLLNFSVLLLTYSIFIILILLFIFLVYIIYSKYNKYKIYRNPETNTLNKIYMTENYEKINFDNYYVVLADIDFFKRINNLYGQRNGDKIIISVIKLISSHLGKRDMFIQYSGEEFLLFILKENLTEQGLRNLLEIIRTTVEQTKFTIGKEKFSLTISMGVLLNTGIEKSLQDVIHKADTALYEAKHNGRNLICYFDISQTKRLYREKLKEMIESDKLVCYYQPIRDLETRELHHYEALLRIEDGANVIFPDKILPDLEDSYLYTHLTKRVIEYNVTKLREDKKMRISVNLSADDLINDSILSLLAQNADLANRLYIEILENKSIDYKKVELSLQKLKLFGYKICIDDFGAGYSNLGHLLNLSIDYLKIDGSIIKEIHHDKKAYSIVKTFATFCKQNDIGVIAEFIDNQEVVNILKGFGVKYGQGWYFSKAVPYDDLDKEHK
jgi:diguanylate cyclase (GGDEF)-like protein